jgi:collagenase-like PrtC family protease
MGIRLNLLFNANCYGKDAISKSLERKVMSILEYLKYEQISPCVVTTASPAIAFILKENYPDIDVKASVNMRIGSIEGIEYVSELFDSFCLSKECNRDISRLKEIYSYARSHGKKITLLANSGCLRNCSGQIFHDNMVAHESEIVNQKNIDFLPYVCYRLLRDTKKHSTVLKNTWIRPEDLYHYEGLCDSMKLATRMHALPAMVIDAYSRQRYSGNLLDLFEPGHGPLLAPYVVDNDRFPSDWFDKTSECNKNCEQCSYCNEVWEKVSVNTEM